jgi:hypothetical protein
MKQVGSRAQKKSPGLVGEVSVRIIEELLERKVAAPV